MHNNTTNSNASFHHGTDAVRAATGNVMPKRRRSATLTRRELRRIVAEMLG